ncbi:glycosyltransferase family 9 protein [Fundidesulfovibrio agrisoli]|uniref:glycosyltransferase family 9 protein n=1 Tax=Fundidesulfovibrio agrisoli TaxID=2922717 RepID=UPI001FAD914F
MAERSIAVLFKGSIGDELNTTPLVRALSIQRGCKVVVKMTYAAAIYEGSPYATETGEFTNYVLLRHPGPEEHGLHLIDHYARLAGVTLEGRGLDFFPGPSDAVDELPQAAGAKRVAVDTRCGWPSRQWPLRRFRQLTDELRRAGVEVVEVGKTLANCFGQTVEDRLGNADRSFLDRLSLRQTAHVLSRCDLFIGCDSGLSHLAAAVGTPAVTLFGPIHPATRMHASTIPIFADACPNHRIQHVECQRGGNVCMRSISVDTVRAAALRALFKTGRGR